MLNALTAGLGMGIFFVALMFALSVYVYVWLALQTIATKTNTANAWLAGIPIANLFLMLGIAKKPMWWFLLLLVPLVNIVIAIMVWMAMAEAQGKPSWWGILTNRSRGKLSRPGVLAWSD
jgi:Family of unknown function (DUF5684)